MSPKPVIKDDPLYQLLRHNDIQEFNNRREAGETCDLTNCDLRGLDLRGLNANDLDLSGSYFRSCDLRGIDFRKANLEGVSLASAKISGCYFPKNIKADEIRLSLATGVRVRSLE